MLGKGSRGALRLLVGAVLVGLSVAACGDDDGASPSTGGESGAATAGRGGAGASGAGAGGARGGADNPGGAHGGDATTGGASGSDGVGVGGAGGESGAGGSAGDAEPTLPQCAAPLDGTVPSRMIDLARCLFEGADPPQRGVKAGTIAAERVAVLRGRVLDASGEPLSGVRVSVSQHPELGDTLSRADGYFDLAANGGGSLTVRYELAGYLSAQRRMASAWRRFSVFPDVVLLPMAADATEIDLSRAEMAVAEGAPVSDASGERQEVLLIAPGTKASLVLPNGKREPLTSLHVRVQEFTVGELGPLAMPADLPDNSGYTYAVAYTADEAEEVGARVEFEPPVVSYVDNFLHFPAGTVVPNGVYAPDRDTWLAEASGVVLDILAVDGGLAEIDADGDGHADSPEALAALGVSDDERRVLAERYRSGHSLWRTLTPHFSIWDKNWDIFPPIDGVPPDGDVSGLSGPGCHNEAGSLIGCETQTLGERLSLPGTPFTLSYQSERTRGSADSRRVRVQLSGSTVPKSLRSIVLEIFIAGRVFYRSYGPGTNLHDDFVWDGKDAYGRDLQGQQPLVARIGYVYGASYQRTLIFGYNGNGVPITSEGSRTELTIWQTFERLVGTMRTEPLGFGGWAIDANHVLDLGGQTLYLGSGGQIKPSTTSADVISTVAGSGPNSVPERGDGGPASQAFLDRPQSVVAAPDGSIFIAEGDFVRKVAPDGTIATYAGSGLGPPASGDDGPATEAALPGPASLALGPDGTLFIAGYYQVRAVSTDGTIRAVAGVGPTNRGTANGDGGPALAAQLDPTGLALGPDGSLYFGDAGFNVVRRIAPDGTISTFAGNGAGLTDYHAGQAIGDGGLATRATLGSVGSVAVNSEGEVFIATSHPDLIRKVDRAGIISTAVGPGGGLSAEATLATEFGVLYPDALSTGPDGSLFFSSGSRVLQVRPDGKIHVVVDANPVGANGEIGDLGPAARASLGSLPPSTAVRADGLLYIVDAGNHRIRRVGPAFPGFAAGTTVVPSSDARLAYVFDAQGRHVSTLDALSRVRLLGFEYDAQGRLARAVDQFENVTDFSRNAAGELTSITGPYNQEQAFASDENGYLASATNANQEITAYQYSATGLLESVTGPRAPTDVHSFVYDELGRLTRDTEASRSSKQLRRTDRAGNAYSVAISTSLGRANTYDVDDDVASIRRTLTDSAGVVSTLTAGGGVATRATPTRSTTTTLSGDPRFGMQAPVVKSRVVTLAGPGGPTQTVETTRSVTLADFADPLNVASAEETVSVNGEVWHAKWEAANSSYTLTSPEGRQLIRALNSLGQTKSFQVGDLAPIEMSYDARGNLTRMSVAKRSVSLSYDASGYLAFTKTTLGETTAYHRDPVGRPQTVTLPDGETLALSFDASSNLLSLTPPGQADHVFDYGQGGLLASYEPPTASVMAPVMATSYSYDGDDQVTAVTLPGGSAISPSYDPKSGRITSISAAKDATTLSYDEKTGLLARLVGGGETLAFSYTGDFLTGTTWSGAVAGSVSQTLDAFFRQRSESVGTSVVNFGYDRDGLLIAAGAQTLSRDRANGLLTGMELGLVADAVGYDGEGALADYKSVAGEFTLYQVHLERDALGRILSREETVGGATHLEAYTFDPRGRLTTIRRDSALVGSYTYDANGNRISASDGNGNRSATYDAQDRLLTNGSIGYTYTPEGALLTKTAGTGITSYDYDALGALRSVTLPDATRIDYLVDGAHRRIGRKVNGQLEKAFLYRNAGGSFVVAELDAAGALVSRFIYASKPHVPDAMVRGDKTYRLVSDERGSVRLVVDTATGAVVQQIDYDAWGNVLSDSSPGFQPFGFAGGLYDAETGLVRFGARDYDPTLGRWLSKDPLLFGGGQANLYDYSGNDPVNHVDPTGHYWWIVAGASASFALDLGWQLSQNGGNFGCLDWAELGASALVGAAAGAGIEFAWGAAARGGGEMVSLYRAVGDAELKVIQASGGRIPASLSGLESKYFSATAEGAASYARQAVRGFGDAPYTLIETQVARSSLPSQVLLQVDRNVPAVVLPNTYLPSLSPAQVWTYMPIP